jgi:hypothetical protein
LNTVPDDESGSITERQIIVFLKQFRLLWIMIFIHFLLPLQAQKALPAQAQHIALLRIAEFHPVKALFPAA